MLNAMAEKDQEIARLRRQVEDLGVELVKVQTVGKKEKA